VFRDNLIGVLMLAVCGVVALVIIWQIVTGERLTYDGPGWLIWILAAIIAGGSLYAIFQGRIRGEDQQWPSPTAGRKPLWRSVWDRIRGKDGA
jgi:hypothetical protein